VDCGIAFGVAWEMGRRSTRGGDLGETVPVADDAGCVLDYGV